jgi:hypothetical protein
VSVLSAVSEKITARREKEERDHNARDRIGLCDKEWRLITEIVGEEEVDFGKMINDTEEGRFVLPGDHPWNDWLVYQNTVEEDIHFYVEPIDNPEKRIGYKVIDIEVEFNADDGYERVTVIGLEDIEHLKNNLAWANTLAPLEFQFPKSDVQAKRAKTAVRSYLFRNFLREYQSSWLPHPFNLWDKSYWKNNIDPSKWKVLIAPQIGPDTSEWTVLAARFDNLWDLIKATLEDAGLMLTTQRWMPGDSQPFPDYCILTEATLIIDVVEASFVSGATGTILDPILDLVRIVFPDGTSETVTIADPNSGQMPPDGVNPPVVIWRRSQHQGLVNSKMGIHHATGHTVIIGGKSPQWVNNSVKLLLNSALAYIGLLIGLPAAGLGIFDRAVEDVILAWQRFTNFKRKQSMGSHSYRQTYAPGDAWSLSGLQGGRVALHEKRGFISFTAGVIDGVPYRIGQDVDLGHRCGFEIGKRIWLSYVVKKRRKWSRTQPPIWEITIGDSREDELPGSSALRLIETLHAESTRYQNLI